MNEKKESGGVEIKPSWPKRLFARFSYLVTVITMVLAILGGINETIQKIKHMHEDTEKTFLDGFQDYVEGLINQVGALGPTQVRESFFGRLEKCHYGWTLGCDPIVPEVHYVEVPNFVDDATIACLGAPPEKLFECVNTYHATHPPAPPKKEAVYSYGPEGPTRILTYPQIWIFPGVPTFETVRGLPDATWHTAKMVFGAGWLATIIFGMSSIFVVGSLLILIGKMKSKDWSLMGFVAICWLVVGVPYLISGVAWCVQHMMQGVLGVAHGLLSLLILGVGFGSVLSVILEVKHLKPSLLGKG